MKHRLFFLIFILAMPAAMVMAQPAPTPQPTLTPQFSVVIGSDIYVRGGPGRQYLPVGQLVLGEVVRAVSRNMDADWVLIVYHDGFGWVRRDLAAWVEDIDALPVMSETNLTPSPGVPETPEQTVFLLPTPTLIGNWVQLTDAPSGYVRGGPGRTYLRLGYLTTGDIVEPVGRNAETTWILIRFQDGFGWIARNLVHWVDDLGDLPILSPDNLTPTPTFTPTDTPTSTSTPTNTPTSTATPTVTPTPTLTNTPTVTSSPSPSSTPTSTLTQTPTVTATNTELPTLTPSELPTNTVVPTLTATLLASDTPAALAAALTVTTFPATELSSPTSIPTNTSIPATSTIPVLTDTLVPPTPIPVTPTSAQPIASFNQGVNVRSGPGVEFPPTGAISSGETATLLAKNPEETWYKIRYGESDGWVFGDLVTVLGDASQLPVEISPALPSPIPPTTTPTSVPLTATSTVPPTETLIAPVQAVPTADPLTPETESSPDAGIPLETVVGGVILLLVMGYISLYLRGTTAAERYKNGFVIHRCPACDRGELMVDIRMNRLLGIPRPRRTVRCSECRSVLREVGNRRWRYAVDPMENPALYRHYNGREIDDATLIEIAHQPVVPDNAPPQPRPPVSPPAFMDDENRE